MDIVEVMQAESAYWLALAQEDFERGEFELNENLTLALDGINARIDYLIQRNLEKDNVTWHEWMEVYTVLAQVESARAQVKQAQALDKLTHLQAGILERLNDRWM